MEQNCIDQKLEALDKKEDIGIVPNKREHSKA